MDSSAKFLRTFDAFPKLPPSSQVRSTRGSLTSMFMYLFLIFLMWVEIGGYLDGFIDHQFTVDDVVRKDLKLNMDIAVMMPCKLLHMNVQDVTEDRMLASEKLNFEGITKDIPAWYFEEHKKTYTPRLEDVLANSVEARFYSEGQHINEDMPACHIFGTIPINRVKGEFQITAKGRGYWDKTRAATEQMNFTHFISEFSFGDFYPYLDNPLDMTYQLTEEPLDTYQYKLDIVPTMYKKLGMEVDVQQYAMSMYHSSKRYVPGIFFKYDFDAIKMVTVERRLSFFHFLIRLLTILGGIFIITKWVYRGAEKIVETTMGKEFLRRGEEKQEGGLLDQEFETIS